MSFVQSPITVNGDPHQIHIVEHNPQCPNGPLQDGRDRDVERKPMFFQGTGGLPHLFPAVLGQINVRPAGIVVALALDVAPGCAFITGGFNITSFTINWITLQGTVALITF